jgi:hypothetical protein
MIDTIDWMVTDEGLQARKAFQESLVKHITFVREAGNQLKVPSAQLLEHDASKWSMDELPFYARNFFGDKADPEGFVMAWLHHQNYNAHHWEHYVSRSGHQLLGVQIDCYCLEMPKEYALEMVADWMGASYAYTSSWDMSGWLTKNWLNVRLHQKTRQFVADVLQDLGYVREIGAWLLPGK